MNTKKIITFNPDSKLLELIPKEIAAKYRVIPKRLSEDTLIVAMEDPDQLWILDELKQLTGYHIRAVEASSEDIDTGLKEYPETLPFFAEEAVPVGVPSLFIKILRIASFWILFFLPIAVLLWIISTRTSIFGKPVLEVFNYDGAITFAIIWALYAVLLYYVHGVIFPLETEKVSKLEKGDELRKE